MQEVVLKNQSNQTKVKDAVENKFRFFQWLLG